MEAQGAVSNHEMFMSAAILRDARVARSSE